MFKNKLVLLTLFFIILVALAGVFPWLFTRYKPEEINLAQTFAPPSAKHLFGTDDLAAMSLPEFYMAAGFL